MWLCVECVPIVLKSSVMSDEYIDVKILVGDGCPVSGFDIL